MLGENDAQHHSCSPAGPSRGQLSAALEVAAAGGCIQVALHILLRLATPELGWDRQQCRDSPTSVPDSHDAFHPHFPGIIY